MVINSIRNNLIKISLIKKSCLVTLFTFVLYFRRLPDIYDFEISDSTTRFIHNKLNFFLRIFFDISTGNDLRFFFVVWLEYKIQILLHRLNRVSIIYLFLNIKIIEFQTIAGLWIMSTIGTFFSTVNLLYTSKIPITN